MGKFSERVDRKVVHFTDHALDRWWERLEENDTHGRNAALKLLRERLEGSHMQKDIPDWSKVNKYHRALAECFIQVDDDSGFVVNKNPNGDYVAVTFLDRITEPDH